MSKFLQVLEDHTPQNKLHATMHGKVDIQDALQKVGIAVDRNVKDYGEPSFNVTIGDKRYRITVEYIGQAGGAEEEAEGFAEDPETAENIKSIQTADAATASSTDPRVQQSRQRLGATVTRTFDTLSNKLGRTASRI